MSDDFFGGLDKKISALNAAQEAKQTKLETDRSFSERAIQAMHPVARDYAAKLRERGISAQVGGNERGITFDMQWANGAEHGLSVYPDLETGRLKITRKSTDHTTGKRFSFTDGITYDESNWQPPLFESAIKNIINDYIFFAEKHGGFA